MNQTLNQDSSLSWLKSVPLFCALLSERDWKTLLAGMEERTYTSGEVVFRQGEPGDLLYVILSGKVQVDAAGVPLAELTAGQCFGEMAVLDAEPRSATITTLTDTTCLVLSTAQLTAIIQQSPAIAFALLKVLGQRLRRLDHLFGATEALSRPQNSGG